MGIALEKWDTAVDSQAKAFLVGAREAAPLMSDGGRIVAITFAPGGRFGSWQPWVAMGAAKAVMEVLVRYFAVALANRGITVNTISPGWVDDSVLNSLPEVFQTGLREWQERGGPHGPIGYPRRYRQHGGIDLLTSGRLGHRPTNRCGRWCLVDGCSSSSRTPGQSSQPSFRFRHALIQKATYGGLLRGERRRRHARAARAIETAWGGILKMDTVTLSPTWTGNSTRCGIDGRSSHQA